MFDDELSAVPAQAPRPGVLPGMRLRAAIPWPIVIFLGSLVAMFALLPLVFLGSDPRLRLQTFPNPTVMGRVLSSNDATGCRGVGGHLIVYVFSPESGGEFRGAGLVCQQSAYYSAHAGDSIPV